MQVDSFIGYKELAKNCDEHLINNYLTKDNCIAIKGRNLEGKRSEGIKIH